MGYNWEKIFKSKTDKELYDVFIGKSFLNDQAQKFAEKELKLIGFEFDKINKYKKKWELESLYEDERLEKNPFFGNSISLHHYFAAGIIGAILIVVFTLDIFLHFIDSPDQSDAAYQKVLRMTVGFAMTLFGFLGYYNKKRKQDKRKERVKSLINEL